MKITINPYDPESVTSALEQVQKYKKDFLAKEKEFVRRLAEIGVRVAQSGFSTADYDGVNDVTVSLVRSGKKYSVVASGETVGFIEFGTGVKYPEWDDTDMDYTPPKHGTYGKGRGADLGHWWFKQSDEARARHTYGNQPAEAMKTARDEMIEQVTAVAREVWK